MADELGSLTVGKKADLVLYDITSLSLLPRTDPIGLLILGRPNNAVDSVWINGKLVVTDGKVITLDVDNLRQQLFEYSAWSNNRQSKTFAQIEAHYRSVMELSEGLPQGYS